MLVDCLVFFLPVVTDGGSGALIGDGQGQLQQGDAPVPGRQVGLVFPGGGLVVVALDGDFIAEGVFILPEVSVDFLPDGAVDASLKEEEGLPALLRDGQVRAVADGPGGNQAGVRQLADGLLQGEEVGIFLFQDVLADLCHGHGERHPVQHVQDDELIEGHKLVLKHVRLRFCREAAPPVRFP